jgi:hypothetical protein
VIITKLNKKPTDALNPLELVQKIDQIIDALNKIIKELENE